MFALPPLANRPVGSRLFPSAFLLLAIGFMLPYARAQHVNLNFNSASAWTASQTIPGTSSFLYPDGITRTPADFVFNGGVASTWQLNQGAKIICTQSNSSAYNRFFVGSGDGAYSHLTFSSATPASPGTLCARFSSIAAMRIGEAATGSRGKVIIDGGVKVQVGYIYGESTTPEVEVRNGTFEVYSLNSSKHLNNIKVTLGTNGQLWLEDPSGVVKSSLTFSSYVSGAAVVAASDIPAGYVLTFTNNVARKSENVSTTTNGTLIQVGPPPPDTDRDGMPDAWETTYGLSPNDATGVNGAEGDPDGDGLPNLEEYTLGSHPMQNQSGKAWLPRPSKIGLLFVCAHPDDEGIFFGGTLPYYSKVRKAPTLLLSMTSGDYGDRPPTLREGELRNAVWAYGIQYQPLFPRFRDATVSSVDEEWDLWADGLLDGVGVAAGHTKAVRYVATMIRRYRPEVVATHGADGEYGHMAHRATSQAVSEAWTMAADATVDLESLPVWQAKKLYLHEHTTRPLFHDFTEVPYGELGGYTARQVADVGLDYHVTQADTFPGRFNVSTAYLDGETVDMWDWYPSEWWNLSASKVSLDPVAPTFTINNRTFTGWAKGDFFNNINLDADENGLPDEWERQYSTQLSGRSLESPSLSLSPDGDEDGDGVSNRLEYIAGTSPVVAESSSLALSAANGALQFQSRLASGAGYSGIIRHYRVETSPDLVNWSAVWEGDADGTLKTIPISIQVGGRQFYRVATSLR